MLRVEVLINKEWELINKHPVTKIPKDSIVQESIISGCVNCISDCISLTWLHQWTNHHSVCNNKVRVPKPLLSFILDGSHKRFINARICYSLQHHPTLRVYVVPISVDHVERLVIKPHRHV